jgi:hypothetical protein
LKKSRINISQKELTRGHTMRRLQRNKKFKILSTKDILMHLKLLKKQRLRKMPMMQRLISTLKDLMVANLTRSKLPSSLNSLNFMRDREKELIKDSLKPALHMLKSNKERRTKMSKEPLSKLLRPRKENMLSNKMLSMLPTRKLLLSRKIQLPPRLLWMPG